MSASERVPVHVVYGGAHLYSRQTPKKLGQIASASLHLYAGTPSELAAVCGIEAETHIIEQVFERTRRKLETEPVEDFRIDFEDGYGVRSDEEEDSHAKIAAKELARSFREKTQTAFSGFRIKSLSTATTATRQRAERTLQTFLTQFLEAGGEIIPGRFAVTLPKVSHAKEVANLAGLVSRLESENGIPTRSISIELMVETPQAIFDSGGDSALPTFVEAADGRCSSAHFGAYDLTASLGIAAKHQGLRHPACEFARNMMLVTLAPMGIRLVDSVTTEIPTPPHRGNYLTNEQILENREVVHRAWRTHFDNVLYSMSNGFYQSWDLHPNQLVARFAAVNYFYLEGLDEQAHRLKNYVQSAEQATLTGISFDDAASARGIVNFFLRGLNCGALNENEVLSATGLDRKGLAELFSV